MLGKSSVNQIDRRIHLGEHDIGETPDNGFRLVLSEKILFDISCIFSRSEKIKLPEKGYYLTHLNMDQINLDPSFQVGDIN